LVVRNPMTRKREIRAATALLPLEGRRMSYAGTVPSQIAAFPEAGRRGPRGGSGSQFVSPGCFPGASAVHLGRIGSVSAVRRRCVEGT
jgi:hypothetical protein